MQKKISRGSKSDNGSAQKNTDVLLLTPKRRTAQFMRSEGLSPRKHPKVRKQLRLHYSVIEEVKASAEVANRKVNPIAVVSGKIIKKYRLRKQLGETLKVSRRK